MKIHLFFLLSCCYLQLIGQPSNEGLLCWLPFNGNANDESNNNHSATVYGPTLTNDRHGKPNSAYFFDGIDDFMLIPDHPDLRLGNTSFTISAWVRPDAISDLQAHAVISKRTGAGNLGYLFQVIGNAHVMGLKPGAVDIVSSGGWNDPKITTETSLITAQWHHVLYCYDHLTNQGQFVIDNVPDNAGAMIDLNANSNGDFYIGKDKLTDGVNYPDIDPNYYGGYYFKGAIDDIRLYNKKLEQDQISALYNENISSYTPTERDFFFSFFPNPVSKRLTIKTNHPAVSKITIHDLAGRLYVNTNFSSEIDCHQLPAGVFTVSFFDKEGRLIKAEPLTKQ